MKCYVLRMIVLKFYQKLDTCAFYGQIVVALCLNVFNLENLDVLPRALVTSRVHPTWECCTLYYGWLVTPVIVF